MKKIKENNTKGKEAHKNWIKNEEERFCKWCNDVLNKSDDLVCGYHFLTDFNN